MERPSVISTARTLWIVLVMLTPALAAAGRAPSAAYDGKSLPALPDGNGGLAGLSPKQVETIRRARETVKRMASSLYESHWTRIRAVSALLRVHEALNDWGRKESKPRMETPGLSVRRRSRSKVMPVLQ